MRKTTRIGAVAGVWESSAAADHTVVQVRGPSWESYVGSVRALLSVLDREDPDDAALSRALRVTLFRITYTACSPTELLDGLDLPEMLAFRQRVGVSEAGAVQAALDELVRSSMDHPFAEWLKAHGTSRSGPVVFVARYASYVPLLTRCLSSVKGVKVCTPNQLADLERVGSVVVPGSAHKYPSWLQAFPRGRTFWLVWPWSKGLTSVHRFLPAGGGGRGATEVRRETWAPPRDGTIPIPPPAVFDEDDVEPIDWRDLYRRLRSRRGREQHDDGGDELEVVVADVGEGQVVLLPADPGLRTTVFDPETMTVKSLSQREIKPGMFIVVRSRAGRDQLRELVERRFLADPAKMQRSLAEWKTRLRQRLRASGREAVHRALRARGVGVVEQTVATWAGDLTYGPGDHETFKLLMLFLDFFDYDERWAVLEAYREAGRRAGRYVRERLLSQVERMPPGAAADSRVLEFELEGLESGKLHLYRVEHLEREPVVASTRDVGRVLDSWSI